MITQSKPETTALAAAAIRPDEKKHLLMVMNREEMRHLRAVLRPLEAEIDWAPDVDSAGAAFKATSGYDAVVVDDRLPDEGWQKVMELAGEVGVNVPFLVCTDMEGSDRFLTQSKKTFIADLLLRPYDDAIVQERVRDALESVQTEPFEGATIPSHQ